MSPNYFLLGRCLKEGVWWNKLQTIQQLKDICTEIGLLQSMLLNIVIEKANRKNASVCGEGNGR